jgi:predicted nucleic acid-binding protein
VKFLVDANVLSEATKAVPSEAAVDWLRRHEHVVAVNTVVLGELEFGILLLPSGRRRKRLESWFSNVVEILPVLDMDRETARLWAALWRVVVVRPAKDGWERHATAWHRSPHLAATENHPRSAVGIPDPRQRRHRQVQRQRCRHEDPAGAEAGEVTLP